MENANHIRDIEDEQRVSDLINRGLEEQGYTVAVVFDGSRALRDWFKLLGKELLVAVLRLKNHTIYQAAIPDWILSGIAA